MAAKAAAATGSGASVGSSSTVGPFHTGNRSARAAVVTSAAAEESASMKASRSAGYEGSSGR